MGMSKNEFMHSTPKVLNAYRKGYEIKLQTIDTLAWQFCGNYMLSAIMVAMDKAFSGRRAKMKYIEKPILDFNKKETKQLSVEEQRMAFIQKMQAMKANFDSAHPKKESDINDY